MNAPARPMTMMPRIANVVLVHPVVPRTSMASKRNSGATTLATSIRPTPAPYTMFSTLSPRSTFLERPSAPGYRSSMLPSVDCGQTRDGCALRRDGAGAPPLDVHATDQQPEAEDHLREARDQQGSE